MSYLISNITVTQELTLLVVIATAVATYLVVGLSISRKQKANKARSLMAAGESSLQECEWDDRQPLFWRQSLGHLQQSVDLYYIAAFSSVIERKRSPSLTSVSVDTKICVSRSAADTDKLVHPLIKKIEARLRRAELRPRPRLRVVRATTPFPLFSSTRPDIELSTYVLNFLDACIDLSVSCDTQVNFSFQSDELGICISAVWKKNHLIADATAQIELLDHMRLTMSGEIVRWDYQIFECPQQQDSASWPPEASSASA